MRPVVKTVPMPGSHLLGAAKRNHWQALPRKSGRVWLVAGRESTSTIALWPDLARPEGLFHHVREAAFFVTRDGLAMVGFAHVEIVIVPGHFSSRRCPPLRWTARGVSRWIASRTSVTSENITVAPQRTNRSEAQPTAGLAVTPENASLPPHCVPTTSSEAGRFHAGVCSTSRWRLPPVKCRRPSI